MRGWHRTEVAFALLTQQSRVQISAILEDILKCFEQSKERNVLLRKWTTLEQKNVNSALFVEFVDLQKMTFVRPFAWLRRLRLVRALPLVLMH